MMIGKLTREDMAKMTRTELIDYLHDSKDWPLIGRFIRWALPKVFLDAVKRHVDQHLAAGEILPDLRDGYQILDSQVRPGVTASG